MRYFLSVIICISALACTSPQDVEKKQSDDAFLNIFNIYETTNFLNKELAVSKSRKNNSPYTEIRVDKKLMRQCFLEAFDNERAGLLCDKELSIVFIQWLVSDNGKVIGMRIKTAKETDITDNEIKSLSRYLSQIKIPNTNNFTVKVNEQFSFSNDYFSST